MDKTTHTKAQKFYHMQNFCAFFLSSVTITQRCNGRILLLATSIIFISSNFLHDYCREVRNKVIFWLLLSFIHIQLQKVYPCLRRALSNLKTLILIIVMRIHFLHYIPKALLFKAFGSLVAACRWTDKSGRYNWCYCFFPFIFV